MRRSIQLSGLLLVAALLLTACSQAADSNKVTYSLKTGLDGGRMVYIGMGGAIEGVVNPRLEAKVGDIVTINLMTGEGAEHNLLLPDFNVDSGHVVGQGKTVSVTFGVDRAGSFPYFCDLPGHGQAGMEGVFDVAGSSPGDATSDAVPTAETANMHSRTADPYSGAAAASAHLFAKPCQPG